MQSSDERRRGSLKACFHSWHTRHALETCSMVSSSPSGRACAGTSASRNATMRTTSCALRMLVAVHASRCAGGWLCAMTVAGGRGSLARVKSSSASLALLARAGMCTPHFAHKASSCRRSMAAMRTASARSTVRSEWGASWMGTGAGTLFAPRRTRARVAVLIARMDGFLTSKPECRQ